MSYNFIMYFFAMEQDYSLLFINLKRYMQIFNTLIDNNKDKFYNYEYS